MTATYDAIVVGAGIGGLGTSAVLAQSGLRVLTLEAAKDVGGRAYSYSHRGHTTNIGGPRAGLENGRVDALFARLGREPGERGFFDGVIHFKDGEFVELPSIAMDAPQEQTMALLGAVGAVAGDTEELARLDAIPADEWLRGLVSAPELVDMSRFCGIVMTTIPRLADMSASALVESLRIVLGMPRIYLAAHGYGDFMRILAETATAAGGEVRTRTKVTDLLVEGGHVRGVVTKGRDGSTEALEAPRVIAAFPVWELPDIVPAGLLPREFTERLGHLERKTAIFGITAACREPLYEGKHFVLTDARRADHPLAAFMASNVTPSLSPEGEHLFEACCQCDFDLGRDKDLLEETVTLLEADLDEMFPGWREKVIWKNSYFHWEEPARTAGRAGVFRPGPVAPGVDGLYLAGDTVTSRTLPGLECAADSAMACADAVLAG